MKLRDKFAFALYAINSLLGFVTGTLYLSTSTIMPYHEEAIGLKWEELHKGVQILLNASIKGAGIGTYTLGIVTLFLLFIPFRRGERWPRWLIPFLWFLNLGFSLWISTYLHRVTQASTPWQGVTLALILTTIAFLLSGLFVGKPAEN